MQGEAAQISGQSSKLTPNRVLKSWFKNALPSTAKLDGSAVHMPSIPQPRTCRSQPGPPAGEGSRCASRTVTLHGKSRQLEVPELPPPPHFAKLDGMATPSWSYICFRSA